MKRALITFVLLVGIGIQFSNASPEILVTTKKYILTDTWTGKHISFTCGTSSVPNGVNLTSGIPIHSYLNLLGLKSVESSCSNTHSTNNNARSIGSLNRKRFFKYDVFLSHSYKDKKLIESLLPLFQQNGLKVYVDWLDKELPHRSRPNQKTLTRLLSKMEASRILVFVYTSNSSTSTWSSFELGYFTNRAASSILVFSPKDNHHNHSFVGVEYLTMYPTLICKNDEKTGNQLFVHQNY